MPHSQTWAERLVSYQYFEEFLAGRRVLELGCGDGQGAGYLLGRAESLLSLDLNNERVQGCRHRLEAGNLAFEHVQGERFPAEDSSFDVALVPELESWSSWQPLMEELRRVLRTDGMALFSLLNGDQDPEQGLTYADADELLSGVFPQVRFLGQIPFSGCTVADFLPRERVSATVLDCSLVDEDLPPHRYLVLCSERPLAGLSYTVMQTPPREQNPEASQEGGLDGYSGVLSRMDGQRAQLAERALIQAEANVRQHSRRAETAERRNDSFMLRVEQGVGEINKLHQRIAELQGLRQADQWRLDELTSLVHQFEEAAEKSSSPERQQEQLEQEVEDAESRAAEQSRRATNAEARLAQMEARLRRARQEAGEAQAETPPSAPNRPPKRTLFRSRGRTRSSSRHRSSCWSSRSAPSRP